MEINIPTASFRKRRRAFLKVVTLDYPGRGSRMKDCPKDIDELTNDLYDQVRPAAQPGRICHLRHSLGGLMAYKLARKLVSAGHQPPLHFFITGTTGPSASPVLRKNVIFRQNEFLAEIRDLDGMPDEILNNEELLYYFRAHFTF